MDCALPSMGAIRIHAGTQGGTVEDHGKLGRRRRDTCARPCIHAGDDEVLLDDSRRYVERAVAAGVDARLDVWTGMPHGFVAPIGAVKAATQALDASGLFLTERL